MTSVSCLYADTKMLQLINTLDYYLGNYGNRIETILGRRHLLAVHDYAHLNYLRYGSIKVLQCLGYNLSAGPNVLLTLPNGITLDLTARLPQLREGK